MYLDLGAASCSDQKVSDCTHKMNRGSKLTLSFVAPFTDFSNPPAMLWKSRDRCPTPDSLKRRIQAVEKQGFGNKSLESRLQESNHL
jgi:hypothetical protein